MVIVPVNMIGSASPLFQWVTPTGTPTATPTVEIYTPSTGQAVQGKVSVVGVTAVQDFQSAELYFGYMEDRTETWFLIGQYAEPLAGAEIGTWDTNLITDGNYRLRLVVILQDGSRIESMVNGVRVRNYSPIETSTPTPVTPTATLSPDEKPTETATPLPTATATATLLPTNPAEIGRGQIIGSLAKGALGALLFFVFLGIYLFIRQDGRKNYSGHEAD